MGYHLAEGEAWLAASDEGASTTHLAYAAFELRLEAERIVVELLRQMQGGSLSDADLFRMRSFKSVEARIYELEGHQRLLNRKTVFSNIFTGAVGLPTIVWPVKVGHIGKIWHTCSELCHLPWTLVAAIPTTEAISETYRELVGMAAELRRAVENGITWMTPRDADMRTLQDAFLAGEVDEEGVRAWIHERGLWGRVVHPDGSSEFVGTPVPPAESSPPSA